MAERHTRTTFCRICEATCGLVATVEGDRVVALDPDPEHVVTRGYACTKGLHYHEVHHSPDRLEQPLKRKGDGFETISWEQALREIGTKLRRLVREHGGDSVGGYLGNPISFSLFPPILMGAFLNGLGSRNLFQTGSQDCNNKFAVAERIYGYPFLQPFPDIERTECLIVIGSNPAVSRASFVQLPDPVGKLRAIEKRGGRVFLVNPRRTETARQLGTQVFIRPDTDIFFLLSFLHEVFERGAVVTERVDRHMRDLDVLRSVAEPWPAERSACVTGIAAATLREMVDVYLAAHGAALYSSTGVNQGSHGTLAFWIQETINAITGNLDRRGGTLVGPGFVKNFPEHGRKSGNAMREDRSRVGNLASVVDSFPAGILADEILTPGEGQIRAMIVLAGNPLLSVPNREGRLAEALRALDLLVVIDIFRTETADLADYILPGSSFLQRPDLPFVFQSLMGVQPEPYAQYTEAVAPLVGGQRDESMLLIELARASGSQLFGSRVAQALLGGWQALGSWPGVGERLGLTPERLLAVAARGFGLGSLGGLRAEPHGRRLAAHAGEDFLGHRVVTEDGLVHLAPADLVAAVSKLEKRFEREIEDRGRLKLISKREPLSHNSWFHNVERFVRGRRNTNHLYMHPQDADRVGVSDGALVEVASAHGRVRLPVQISADMMPGSVALPHGWGHGEAHGLSVASRTGGANVNLLADDGPASVEALSGMAQLTGLLVDVRPVDSVSSGR